VLNAVSKGFTVAGYDASTRKPGITGGLYTITFLGIWYRGDAPLLEGILRRRSHYGYDGVEIDVKRPHGNIDMPATRCRELCCIADGEGVEIYSVAANNDFSGPITEHLEMQVLYVCERIRVASNLGARTVRVFLAWPGTTERQGVASYDIARPLWRTVHRAGVPG
jgi:sugar phosphate isomerase/epimerase